MEAVANSGRGSSWTQSPTRPNPNARRIEGAVAALKRGELVVVIDDLSSGGEGILTLAAEMTTAEAVNFMTLHARGLVCLGLTPARCEHLRLSPIANLGCSDRTMTFTVSVDACEGVTTGISSADRARTIRVATADDASAQDLVCPGHVFPIRTHPGGVLMHPGKAEAAVDLARLAGLAPAGVICAILNHDGAVATRSELVAYCREHALRSVTIGELVDHRRRHERLVERLDESALATRFGEFRAIAFRETLDDTHHLALVKGDVAGRGDVLVRVHSECLTGDVFRSRRCDCGEQLVRSLEMIGSEPRGVLVYLSQEGRGIGLLNKLRAYALQDDGLDTVEANHRLGFPDDLRDYGVGAQMLADLGVKRLRLLTNNPRKIARLEHYGIEVAARVPIEVMPHLENVRYLQAKRDKLGHRLRHTPAWDAALAAQARAR